jgi:hypothetical protein
MAWADIDDAKYWRDRAAEARAVAEVLTNDRAKGLMLDIAFDYDWLAKRAEGRTSRGSDGLQVQA